MIILSEIFLLRTLASTTTTEPEICNPFLPNNFVYENLHIKENWMVEIDIKLNATDPDGVANMFQLMKIGENGIPVYGEHGIKTPICKL